MKLRGITCIAPLLLASSAAARTAYLLTPRHSTQASISRALSPSDAAFVLAQRAGQSQHYSLQGSAQETLDAINDFGVPSSSLFSDDDHVSKPSFVVVLDGVDVPEDLASQDAGRRITIANPPSSASTHQFLKKLYYADSSNIPDDRSCELEGPSGLEDCVGEWLVNAEQQGRRHVLYYSKQLRSLAETHATSSQRYQVALNVISSQLSSLLGAPSSRYDITFLLLPLQEPGTSISTLFRPATWPSPSRPSTLVRRREPEHQNPARQPPSAAQLSPRQSTSAPLGILPQCYSSEDSCNKATNSCTGHGSCKVRYSRSEDNGIDHTCYACVCEATTEERSGGAVKTTVWAGPACQKKDVSVPFWLLFGTTLVLLFAVAWGMSLLYSMGSEELPGVLSAGVAGIGARAK